MSSRSAPPPLSTLLGSIVPIALAGLAGLAALAAPAAAWRFADDPSPAAFEDFHLRFSSDVYAYPRHPAAPLGLTGFEIYADATYDDAFDGQAFYPQVIRGSLPSGVLSVGRVGVRKGLPGGVDVGASYGTLLDGDVDLGSVELQWAAIHGGVLEPAVAFRLTGTQTLGGGRYDLRQLGAEVLVSKGFTVLTPYVGAGMVRSRGRLDRVSGGRLEDTTTRPIVYAGATLNLLIPRLTFEVERGDATQYALRLGIGF
jgi:hypothetical protein